MDIKMQERIQIINSFKHLYESRSLDIDKRIAKTRWAGLGFSVFLVFMLVIFIITIFNDLYNLGWRVNWTKASILVMFGIMVSINFSNEFYKYILLKHLKNIKNNQESINVNTEMNSELNEIVDNLDQPRKRVFLYILAGIIFLGAILNMFMNYSFEYWRFFKIPTLVYFALIFKETYQNYLLLKLNIEKVECKPFLL
jgi:hypothetical protein